LGSKVEVRPNPDGGPWKPGPKPEVDETAIPVVTVHGEPAARVTLADKVRVVPDAAMTVRVWGVVLFVALYGVWTVAPRSEPMTTPEGRPLRDVMVLEAVVRIPPRDRVGTDAPAPRPSPVSCQIPVVDEGAMADGDEVVLVVEVPVYVLAG
jgi:hypothetical protein